MGTCHSVRIIRVPVFSGLLEKEKKRLGHIFYRLKDTKEQ